VGTHKVRGKCPACDGPAQIYYEDKTVEKLADGIPQELIVNCPKLDLRELPRNERKRPKSHRHLPESGEGVGASRTIYEAHGQSVGSRYRLAVSDDPPEGDMGDILERHYRRGFLQDVRDALGFSREDGGRPSGQDRGRLSQRRVRPGRPVELVPPGQCPRQLELGGRPNSQFLTVILTPELAAVPPEPVATDTRT
jgi:hypothetical protein